ncbi:MAG TPA: J domain-containing protein, partial [Kofleriaceae bacterium]|nr:J domain-containing protein [Kofleriaceae bacterium]
ELAADLARELLEAMPEGTTDAKLKSIYNRHTGGNFDRERAHAEAAESRAMQDVLEQHGFDFGGEQFDSLEELEAAARAQRSTEASQGGTQRTSSRKKSARQEAAERKRETEASQVSRALQDVYRKLAHALHPDRERDPVERARKTQLMADVNVAYERRDLLALLELQLQFEQIDHAHIAGLAEDRLAHFNKLLAEQVAQLKQELAAIEHPYRVHLDVPPPRKLPPAYVIACLRDDIETLTDDLEHVQQDVRTLRAEIEVKMWLRARRDDARRTNDALEAFLELSLMVKGGTRRRRRRT